jgi:hypothetical protein
MAAGTGAGSRSATNQTAPWKYDSPGFAKAKLGLSFLEFDMLVPISGRAAGAYRHGGGSGRIS